MTKKTSPRFEARVQRAEQQRDDEPRPPRAAEHARAGAVLATGRPVDEWGTAPVLDAIVEQLHRPTDVVRFQRPRASGPGH